MCYVLMYEKIFKYLIEILSVHFVSYIHILNRA